MDSQQCFFGFEISADLYHSCVQVIKDIDAALTLQNLDMQSLDRRAAENVNRLTDTGFEAYYAKPSSMIELSNVLRKAADAGVSAVQKGVHMVIRKVIIGTPLPQLKVMSDYMSQLLCESETEPGRYFVCFTLTEELFSLAQTLLARVRTDSNVEAYRRDIIAALERLIEAGIDAYYAKPVDQVKLGRITRTASDLGIKTAHKGTTAVVHKLFKEMPHQAMLPLAAYFESLLHDEVRSFQSNAA